PTPSPPPRSRPNSPRATTSSSSRAVSWATRFWTPRASRPCPSCRRWINCAASSSACCKPRRPRLPASCKRRPANWRASSTRTRPKTPP
ncbi:hypothetical protein LTR94_035428, partial [Friedmanniomyces endolithicus]